MAEDYGETIVLDSEFDEPIEEKKDNKVWIIIVVVLIVLCCCVIIVGSGLWALWTYGDDIFDLAANFPYLLM
jgi:hypothetical protein